MLLFFFFFGVAAAAAAGECATTKNGEEMVRLTASSTSETIASVLKEYGAVIVETLSEEPLMEILAHELGNASGIFFGSKDSFAGEQTSRNAAKPLGESAIARSLATNDKIVSVADILLKPFCKKIILGTCSAITVWPPPSGQEPAPPQALHRDDSMWAADDDKIYSLSVMWAVTDFTEENGATRLCLKSHRHECADLTTASMPKGSALLWLGSTLHGAGTFATSSTAQERAGLLFIYNLGFLRSEHNFHNAIPPDIIQSFPQNLKDLIGYEGQNAIAHPWITGPVYAQPYLGGPQGSASGDGVQFATTTKKTTTAS